MALCFARNMVSVDELKLNFKISLNKTRVKFLLHLKYDGKYIKVSLHDENKLKHFPTRSCLLTMGCAEIYI